MAKQPKYTDEECRELVRAIAGVVARAREIQHLCWEMQPELLTITRITHKHENMIDQQDRLFHGANNLRDAIGRFYHSLPIRVRRENYHYYVHELYGKMNDFMNLDDFSEKQKEELYQKLISDELIQK